MDKWCHHGYFTIGQFSSEAVFFENCSVAPAIRAIELGDQRLGIFDTHLIDTVLVAVERQDASIAKEADALYGVENQVGRERFEGMGHVSSCCAVPCMVSHIHPAA
ncbi:hypothetical protein D3C77_655560 [compost metagenome]